VSSAPVPTPACAGWRRVSFSWLFLSLFPFSAHAVDPNAQKPVIEAPEVAISATRTERSVLDVPGNVTVIDRETIRRGGARSVPEVLRREAGLMVTGLGSTPEGFTVEARGFNNGGGNGCSTLVLVDGRRLNEPETGCPDWSFVALEDIERIEVVRGPASVAYGDNAAAGVIHIFTGRPREDGMRIAGAADTGSYGAQNTGLRLAGREGGVFATGFVADVDSNGYRHQSDFVSDAFRLGIGADLAEAGELRLDGGYDSNLRERPGALNREQMHEDRRQADPDNDGDENRARARYLLGTLALRPVEDVELRVVPSVRRRDDDGLLSGDAFGGPFDFVTDTETEQLGVDAQVDADFDAFGQRHNFLFGGEARREDADIQNLFDSFDDVNDSFTDVHLRRETWGLFVQQEVGLREDLHLLLGVRRDEVHYDGSGFQESSFGTSVVDVDEEPSIWSPRASLNWRVAEPVGLYAGWARGFRSANVQETVSLFGVAPADPQKTESWEIGGKYREGDCALDLALFWMNVKDEILFNPFTFENANFDRVQHRGVEVAGSSRPLEWLEVHASYTFDDVRIQNEIPTGAGATKAGRIPITPKHRGGLGATVFLPWGFEVGADAFWVGARPLANDFDNSTVSARLHSYGSYDARVAWSRQQGPFWLLLEAIGRNLTDAEYAEFGGEASFGGPPGYFPSAERNWLIGMRLEYRL
jgi:iron complex outermembrane recepter protein